jgi:putative hydrolase of the HAD superfamily
MNYLIWDFDGTLGYRTEGMWTGVLLEVLRQEAPAFSAQPTQLRPYLQAGFPWHPPYAPHPEVTSGTEWWDRLNVVFERAFKGLGFDALKARLMARRVRDIFPDPTYWRVFDDAHPALGHLAAEGWTHVMLSNHVPELRIIVEHLALTRHFKQIFNSAEIGYEKPHFMAFRTVLNTIPDATTVWMIGDSLHADITGAEAVGLPGILVRRYHEDARYYAEDLTQLSYILKGV